MYSNTTIHEIVKIDMNISDNKLQELIKFNPHTAQQAVLNSPSRDIAICAGRRFGKSAICGYLALKELLQDNKKIWIVSPTYDLSLKVFNYLVQWYLKTIPSGGGHISYRPTPKIKTSWGSTVECKSADSPTGLLGEELDLIICDEASRIPKNVWEAYLFPTTASRRGRSIFISTPFGKNWFYYKWLEVKETDGAFHFKSTDNPSFPPEEWDRARKLLPENVFKQEYEALFLDDAAAVFRNIREVVNENSLEDVKGDHLYVMGVDLAKYQDFSVITIIDITSHKVVYWDRFKEISYPLQKSRITAAAKRYNNSRIIIDSTGVGDPIVDDLKRDGLIVEDFRFSNKSKQQIIEKLSLFIEQKGIIIPPNMILIDELESYGYQMSDSGNIKYSAPTGLHDDCVISLGLAVWGLRGTQGEAENPTKDYEKFKLYDFNYT